MTKYSGKTQEYVENAIHEYKEGDLTIGKSDKKVNSTKQAIAIGLSEAREAGEMVPPKESNKDKKRPRKWNRESPQDDEDEDLQ